MYTRLPQLVLGWSGILSPTRALICTTLPQTSLSEVNAETDRKCSVTAVCPISRVRVRCMVLVSGQAALAAPPRGSRALSALLFSSRLFVLSSPFLLLLIRTQVLISGYIDATVPNVVNYFTAADTIQLFETESSMVQLVPAILRNPTTKKMCRGFRLCALSMNDTLIQFPYVER